MNDRLDLIKLIECGLGLIKLIEYRLGLIKLIEYGLGLIEMSLVVGLMLRKFQHDGV